MSTIKGDGLLIGTTGNDVIAGGAGSDYLDGGAGNDILYGGQGTDRVHGGSGNDTFGFIAGDLAVTDNNFDFITDFHGAGVHNKAPEAAGTEQDFIKLTGFGAGSTLSFVQDYGSAFTTGDGTHIQNQLYYVNDPTDPSHSGYILVGIVGDGVTFNHLGAGDYAISA